MIRACCFSDAVKKICGNLA